jgi:hypothetical protein
MAWRVCLVMSPLVRRFRAESITTYLYYTAIHSRTRMPDKDYRVALFKEKDFERRKCPKCIP